MRLIVVFLIDLYPYVRTTRRQMYVDPAYQKYDAAKKHIRAATVDAMNRQSVEQFAKEPLRLALFVNVPQALHKRDLSNILKGVEDGMQHTIFSNDAWIDQVVVARALVTDREQRAVAVIQPVSDGPASFFDWLADVEKVAKWEEIAI